MCVFGREAISIDPFFERERLVRWSERNDILNERGLVGCLGRNVFLIAIGWAVD